MLIRFGCSNYRSVYDYQEIIFTASSLKDEQSDLILKDGFKSPLLPSIALYGANASGKTNMLLALRKLVGFVENSHKHGDEKGITRKVFKLSKDSSEECSEFDMDFICKGTHYHYGYKIDSFNVLEEWLFSYSYGKRGSRRVLFHRNREEEDEFYFGKYLKGQNKTISELVRGNSLFLSAAAQNNHETLKDVYSCIVNGFSFRFDHEMGELVIAKKLADSGYLKSISSFLEGLGTGIEKIEIGEREIDEVEKKLHTGMTEVLKSVMPDSDFDINFEDYKHKVNLFHKGRDGSHVKLDISEESRGTRSIIALLIPIFEVLKTGGILVVDEIESSLHALLTREVIKLFGSSKSNPKGAQLLFSTHEANALCKELLRRDQIWFAEKTLSGNTAITPLTDFKLRKSFDIQSGYLEGRFGAIPFFGDIEGLMVKEN